ncbi:amidase family protein [Streptomyces sp. NPDC012510]|uniref:amidase n=1 Tax=Streptomyces sp. NPDC012510 TaxID=3364838 RepID=UPI0036EDF733
MDLNYLSADEMLGAFRRRELAPVEVLDSLIERVAKTSEVNAVAEEMFDEAHDVARAAEARYAGKGPAPRALEGVPVAVKEEMPIAGRSHRFGSLLTEGNVATQTQPMVQRLIDAGAVLHLRTTTPEFSIAVTTHSALWGVTRNPWNLDYSPGGSSGGSGAALAAGLAPLATGSDIAGSIRVPSALCGVVGFRPPYGRVPSLPPLSLDTYCQDGPMARTVTDCALFQNVIAGPDPVDHASVPAAPPLPTTFGSCAGLKVALAVTIGDFPVVPQGRRPTSSGSRAPCGTPEPGDAGRDPDHPSVDHGHRHGALRPPPRAVRMGVGAGRRPALVPERPRCRRGVRGSPGEHRRPADRGRGRPYARRARRDPPRPRRHHLGSSGRCNTSAQRWRWTSNFVEAGDPRATGRWSKNGRHTSCLWIKE